MHSKKVYHFFPLFAIFIPTAIQGFYFKFGIVEEIYFRGIIPKYFRTAFSIKGVIVFSTFIFGIGHIATAFTAKDIWQIFLTILNAFLFGWLTIEIEIISKNIMPVILLHFLFDLESKIVTMNESMLLLTECVRGAVVYIAAVWLATVIQRN